MVRTVENEPLKKHTLFLYDGDFDKLATFYPELGASVAVRRVVRQHIKRLEAGVSAPPQMETNLDV
jgi:hypothetical protein